MSRWCLQLCYGEFVVWGYGPKYKYSACHIDSGKRKIVFKSSNTNYPLETILDFSLPEHKHINSKEDLIAPEIYERKMAWSWRFSTLNYIHNTHWSQLEDSKEKCLEKAIQYAHRHKEEHTATGDTFIDALNDIREDRHDNI